MKRIVAIGLLVAFGMSAGCQKPKEQQGGLQDYPPASPGASSASTLPPPLPPPGPTGTDVGAIPPPPITTATPAPTPAPGGQRTHVVAPGETLRKIAAKYYGAPTGANVQKIVAANPGITDPNKISVGQKLIIP
jgi:nucleoid-associated protein YgaU